ncbi:MAG: trigger factor, partial [Chloroflexi bacterium]|nr:trigger factor [Chloroflexota bacterium]
MTQEKIGPCLVALQVEVEPERVDTAMQKAAKRIAQAGRVAGFRKGKAPYHLILRTYGKPAVLQEAVDELGNQILKEAVAQQDIKPYDRPALEVVKTEPLTLKFTVSTTPAVDLGAYRAIRVESQPAAADEAEVNSALERTRKAHATTARVERPAQMSDMLRLDVKVQSGDKTMLDRKDADVELVEGEDDIAPGFSAAMIGAQSGEARNFELAVPADHPNTAFAGLTLQVSTQVKDIQEVTLPPLDDELAKTAGTFETLDELRADLRQKLLTRAEERERGRFEDEVVKAALGGAHIEFPDAMAEEELRHSLSDLMRDVSQMGYTFENWLRMNNLTMESLRASFRPGVEERLRRSLLLFNVAEREGIKVEAADVDAAVDEQVANYPAEIQDTARTVYNGEEMRATLCLRLLQQRAMEKL